MHALQDAIENAWADRDRLDAHAIETGLLPVLEQVLTSWSAARCAWPSRTDTAAGASTPG